MKISSMYKNLQAAGVVAVLALGISSQASAAPVFTVDPNAAFGALGGPHPGSFQADFITGNASTHVGTPGSPNVNAEGWVNLTGFTLNNVSVAPLTSGLGVNWQMWAEFTYDLKLNTGTYAQLGSTYIVTALHADFWVDPTSATATTFTAATNGGGLASVTHGADSFKIATADLINGVADLNAAGGTGFNSTNTFNLLNPAGTSLFTSPNPFFTIQLDEFNNTSQGVSLDPAGKFITINQATGGVDFNKVPEPATLALLGIGLLGIGVSRRRHKA